MIKTTKTNQDEAATAIFQKQFGYPPPLIVHAPGRVNLIGEHTDYNEGFVLPFAIDHEVVVAASIRDSKSLSPKTSLGKVYSANYKNADVVESIRIGKTQSPWANYVRAVMHTWLSRGLTIPKFDAVVIGDVPQGAGLSSSAALEVAIATTLNALSGTSLTKKDLALLAQEAENKFVGVACGIMDQMASTCAMIEQALLIDCRTLELKHVPLNLKSHNLSIIVTHSGISRGLVGSKYNVRTEQCQVGVAQLATLFPAKTIKSLRDVSLEEFLTVKSQLPKLIAQRCHHVISENQRVLECVSSLETNNFAMVGQLMNESHRSLSQYYEVSTPELDLLVDLSQKAQGVHGSRLTGAGFGGCTITLIETEFVATYIEQVIPEYKKQTGKQAQTWSVTPSAGATVISNC